MAADGQVNIKLKVTAENGGVQKVEQGLGRVGKAAKNTASESKGALEQMQGAVGKVQGAFGALRNVLTGFGIGAFVGAMTAGIGKVVESFGSAKKAAEDFDAVQTKLAEEKRIASLATDYAKLTDAINAAAEAENRDLERIDAQVSARRRLEEAKLEAAKEDEISKLDTNAEDYAEQLDKIEKKYAAIKAHRDSSNATEDIVLARQKLYAQADQTGREADAQAAATKAIQAKIDKLRGEQSTAEIKSVSLNEHDKTNAVDAVGKTMGQLFSGEWGRMADAKTAEGDAERKAQAEKAAELEKQIQGLEEEKRKSQEAEAKKRRDQANTREKADAMSAEFEIAKINGDTAHRRAWRGQDAAQNALEKKQDEIQKKADEKAEEEAYVADAKKAKVLLAQQKAELTARIDALRAKKVAAGVAVYQAQGTMDQANLGGNRRERRSAQANLQAAQDAALNVSHATDSAINALKKVLDEVEKKMNDVASVIERSEKQRKNFTVEMPAGA